MKNINDKDELFLKNIENNISIYGIEKVYTDIFQTGFDYSEKHSKHIAINFANYCIRSDWKENRFAYGKTTEELYEEFINLDVKK